MARSEHGARRLRIREVREATVPIASGIRNAYAGLRPDRDVLQFDPTLCYDAVEYVRTLAAMRRRSWSARTCIPHGGHLFNVHLAAGLRLGGVEAYPDVFRPFGDLPAECPVTDGFVPVPGGPGIGHEEVLGSTQSCATPSVDG